MRFGIVFRPRKAPEYYPPYKAIAHGEKVSKEDASYKKGKPNERCGVCEYYGDHKCRWVFGYIGENMWCKYFLKNDHDGDEGAQADG